MKQIPKRFKLKIENTIMKTDLCYLCKRYKQIVPPLCKICLEVVDDVCVECGTDLICDVCIGITSEDETTNRIIDISNGDYFESEIFSTLEDDDIFSDSSEHVLNHTSLYETMDIIPDVSDLVRENSINISRRIIIPEEIEENDILHSEYFDVLNVQYETSNNEIEPMNSELEDDQSDSSFAKMNIIRFQDESTTSLTDTVVLSSNIQDLNPFDSTSSEIDKEIDHIELETGYNTDTSSEIHINHLISPSCEGEIIGAFEGRQSRNQPNYDLLSLSDNEFSQELERCLRETEAIRLRMTSSNTSVTSIPISVTPTELSDTLFSSAIRSPAPYNTPVGGIASSSTENSIDEEPNDPLNITFLCTDKDRIDKILRELPREKRESMMEIKYSPRIPVRDPEFIRNISMVNQLTGEIDSDNSSESLHYPISLEMNKSGDDRNPEKSDEDMEALKKGVQSLITYYESLNK